MKVIGKKNKIGLIINESNLVKKLIIFHSYLSLNIILFEVIRIMKGANSSTLNFFDSNTPIIEQQTIH